MPGDGVGGEDGKVDGSVGCCGRSRSRMTRWEKAAVVVGRGVSMRGLLVWSKRLEMRGLCICASSWTLVERWSQESASSWGTLLKRRRASGELVMVDSRMAAMSLMSASVIVDRERIWSSVSRIVVCWLACS